MSPGLILAQHSSMLPLNRKYFFSSTVLRHSTHDRLRYSSKSIEIRTVGLKVNSVRGFILWVGNDIIIQQILLETA
jgi:hypothetical protein